MNQLGPNFAADLAGYLAPVLERDITAFIPVVQDLCESPIEAMLGVSIFYLHRILMRAKPIFILGSTKTPPDPPATGLAPSYLVPQAPFEQYRIDWMLHFSGARVLIECDGHDFHERTKEQAAHDREKDRTIQLAGLPILRFHRIRNSSRSCGVRHPSPADGF